MTLTIPYDELQDCMHKLQPQLKPFQYEALKFAKTHDKILLEAYMGTGKTLMGLTAAFMRKPNSILIICSKNALHTWHKEVLKWYPCVAGTEYHTIITGSKAKRKQLWRKDSLFYVCTFQTFIADCIDITKVIVGKKTKRIYRLHAPRKFDHVIADEVHRPGLRNRKTQITGSFKVLLPAVKSAMLMTGTLISRGPQDMWAMLNLCDPKYFSSYWRFINTFCNVVDGQFGKEILGPKNTEGLAESTKHVLYQIPKSVTDKYQPPITRDFIDVEMAPKQAKAYKELNAQMYMELADESLLITSTQLAKLTRLRQLCICPRILGVDSDGIAIETVVDRLKDLETTHAMIFTPFRKAIPYFEAYVRKHLTPNVFVLWGGMSPQEVKHATEECKRTRGILIASIQFAQSYEIETANLAFFIGYDWDQNNNFQAESRIRRLISENDHIYAYYLKHKDSMEIHELDVLNTKTRNCRITYQDINQLRKVLQHAS